MSIIIDESETAFSMASVIKGKSQSLGSISRVVKPIERVQSESLSSFSTFNEAETEVESKRSTSEFKEIEPRERELLEREPLVEKTRRVVSFSPNVDLSSASLSTHRGAENLNPTRDGVFARVQRILFPVAIGAAVGATAGGVGVDAFEKINSTYVNATKAMNDIIDNNKLLNIFN